MAKRIAASNAAMPVPLNENGFNAQARLPHELNIAHIKSAMNDFLSFLGTINGALATGRIEPLEAFLMPANFSSIVGEFMGAAIPKYCPTLVKNRYHNGHPDLIPIGIYADDACLHGQRGIEIKASRRLSGWQGHNAEDVWLMVFVFDSSSPREIIKGTPFKPFCFLKVIGARITKSDWNFSGRSQTSRRTITASVTRTGFKKMEANWLYRNDPSARPRKSPEKNLL